MTEFDAARRAAIMTDLLRVLRGQQTDLLPFDAVRKELGLHGMIERGTAEVPLGVIVGTIGREREFNRAFLPRSESIRGRWKTIENLAQGLKGFPPVELYKVGNVYFVVDGHHRISVARSVGAKSIEATVKEFPTDFVVGPEDSVEEIALRAARSDFLEAIGRPDADPEEFRVTRPNSYERMLDHIAGHRYYRHLELQRELPWNEAVESWLERVYEPMITTIRASGILQEFPGRTETDLYLFTIRYLHALRKRYELDDIAPERAVREVEERQRARRPLHRLRRLFRRRRS